MRLTAVLLIPVGASIVMATDWSRMLAYAFPVVIPIACAALRAMRPAAAAILATSYAALVFLVINLQGSTTKYLLEGVVLAAGMTALATGVVEWSGGQFRLRTPRSVSTKVATADVGVPGQN